MRKRNGFRLLAVSLLMAAMLTGCGSSDGATTMKETMEYSNLSADTAGDIYASSAGAGEVVAEQAMSSEEGSAESPDIVGNPSNRKLIRNVDMAVETKEFDILMAALEAQVQELGGYIENLDTYNGSAYSGYRSSREANMTLRIPQNRLDNFLETVSDICNVVRRSESVEDVTLTYVDMESHRDALKTEQSRLLELLEQAESLEDILTIEERLTNIRYKLESMESQLRTMDNQVEYSTVYLSVSEVKELTPVEEKTTVQEIAEGFVQSLRDVGEGFLGFFVWFIVNLPHIAVWAVVVTVVVLIIRKCRKRRKAKKAAAADNAARKDED